MHLRFYYITDLSVPSKADALVTVSKIDNSIYKAHSKEQNCTKIEQNAVNNQEHKQHKYKEKRKNKITNTVTQIKMLICKSIYIVLIQSL